jgi:hypothetical protein
MWKARGGRFFMKGGGSRPGVGSVPGGEGV